jgi:Haem-binding uptake, Tiki superfamily, ChaN
MATSTSLQARQSRWQSCALAGIKREILSYDRRRPSRYLEDFQRAFRSYNSVLDREQLEGMMTSADTVLIGDYHALSASQQCARALLESCRQLGNRPVVLGVEAVFARDQRILDEWWRRDVGEQELRRRIRFDLQWGYDWSAFYQLLVAAREQGEGVYGLDLMPRGDMRKIRARDRHAAQKLGEMRRKHPQAVIVALFGESHLAPSHLPRLLRKQLPQDRVLTVLQNIDSLYSQLAGEPDEVDAVELADGVVCVFNSAPLEKYESYRRCLERWSHEGSEEGEAVACS